MGPPSPLHAILQMTQEVRAVAEPLPQQADAEPPVETSTLATRRRLTARRLYQRRRQRLQELIQQEAKPSSP
jgi:hypothetical protein